MEILKDFGVQPILLVAQMINFLILLFVLNKLLYKPIVTMLDERKKRIEQSMKQAEDIEKRVAKLEEERAAVLSTARQEADKMIVEAIASSKAEAQMLLEKTQKQAQNLLTRASEQSRQEHEHMRLQLKGEVVSVAVAAAQKAVSDVLSKEQKLELTKKAEKEMVA